MFHLRVKKLDSGAKLPRRELSSAGYDLFANESFRLHPEETKAVSTGVAVEIPAGYVGLVTPKSGLGHNQGIVLSNLTGVIDADYRGELKVCLWNRNTLGQANYKEFAKGDKIAQLLIMPVLEMSVIEVDKLSDTDRGDGGFGSTGNK